MSWRPDAGNQALFHGKMKKIAYLSCLIFLLAAASCLAEEQVTITTYYPAPFGVYRELRTNQAAVGSAYRTVPLSDGDILVAGNVGIGTMSPRARLDVAGGVKVGNDPAACDASKTGTVRYNNRLQYCDGSTWQNIAISDYVIMQRYKNLGGGSDGVNVFCPVGYARIACSGGMDYNEGGSTFWDSGDEDAKGYNGAAPIFSGNQQGCTAFADGGNNVYVWAYCVKL